MGLLDMIKGLFGVEKESKEKPDPGEVFRERFELFQTLLKNNNLVLEKMASMEEKLSGEYVFDQKFIHTSVEEIFEGVKNIIDCINKIGENRYQKLNERYADIESKIKDILFKKKEILLKELTLKVSDINKSMVSSVGGKMANLGEIKSNLSLNVPRGFSITSQGFRVFMEDNNIFDGLADMLEEINISDYEDLSKKSLYIQELIKSAHIPEIIHKAINEEALSLADRSGAKFFAVRSSAVLEDREFSFAGQYSTYLNVPKDEVAEKYKAVVASLFNPRALFYFKTKGLDTAEMMMPVGVLEMINSRVSGVAYSKDPSNPSEDVIMISAAEGLGKAVVDGLITPDIYKVKRSDTSVILDRCISCQDKLLSCSPDGGICERTIDNPRNVALLDDNKLKELADSVMILERHFGGPQDVEWTLDANNNIYILQARPLRVNIDRDKPIPRKIDGYKLLITKGSIAYKGIGFGKAFVVKSDEDLKDFPENGVLVAKHTSTKFVTVMNKASAIVTDIGSTTGHMASLSREYEVPTILGTGNATLLIKNGQEITVDSYNCNVYEGIVEELKEFKGKKDLGFMETPIYKKLKEVLRWVAPLNLTDPDSELFKANNCQTLHDITRYCHEMVVRELFDVEYTSADEVGAKKLVAGIPVEIAVLDLGNAIEGNPKYLNPEHLRSIPFNSFLKGLMEMRWPEARDFDISGFMGAIAHTATVTEDDLMRTAQKSFAFISPNFMSFAIRLGYHFSSIEAFAGDNLNDNYIKFFFKKGGTVAERRLRRVRLITKILREMNFSVSPVDDVINAILIKYPLKEVTKRLEILGKLTVYTKQLDMVLFNDSITEQYIEDFCEEYVYPEINQPSSM